MNKNNIFWLGFVCFSLCFISCSGNQAKKQSAEQNNIATAEVDDISVNQSSTSVMAADLPTTNIRANQLITSSTQITVNSEGKWFGFEGELGTVELMDKNNNQLGSCILSTTDNWMVQGPVNYKCALVYTSASAGSGKLVVKQHNPSGEPANDKSFEIPVNYAVNK